MRINKWNFIYVIVGQSAYGREDIDEFTTRIEARKMLKEYALSMPTFSLRIVKRRVLNHEYKGA